MQETQRCGLDLWVRKIPGREVGHSNPRQYSCLENFMNRGVWLATVHKVAKCGTWRKQLSMHTKAVMVGIEGWGDWKACWTGMSDCRWSLKNHFNLMCMFYNANSLTSQFSSVQLLSCVQLLWPHWLQHARPPCLSPTPGVYSNSCPLSQ